MTVALAFGPAPDEIVEELTGMPRPRPACATVRTARSLEAINLLADEAGQRLASVRLVAAGAGQELPLDRIFGLARGTERRAAELSRPDVRADRRGDPTLVLALFRAAYDEALAAGVEEIYLVADQPLLTLLRGYGFRFRAVAGPVWAHAAWSIAAVLPVDEIMPGLRLHQAVHGCGVADFFARHFDGGVPAREICDRRAS